MDEVSPIAGGFRIGRSDESTCCLFPSIPSFWKCASEVIHALLPNASRPGGRDIGHRSLKVTAISVLMAEVAKENANFPQLAARGNYRENAAQDMDKIYSRQTTQEHLLAPKLPLVKYAPGEILEISENMKNEVKSSYYPDMDPSPAPEFQGGGISSDRVGLLSC